MARGPLTILQPKIHKKLLSIDPHHPRIRGHAVAILILRKPPSSRGIRAKDIKSLMGRRLTQYNEGDWKGLVKDLEEDIVIAQSISHKGPNDMTQEERDTSKLKRVIDLMSRSKYSLARKEMQSNGLADHSDLHMIEQMKAKHPARKRQLQDLPIEILQHARKGLDHDKFIEDLLHLPTDSAPGLDGLRNEHLKPLLFGPNRDVPAEAWQAVEEFYQLSNQIVQVNLSSYFYAGHVAT